MSAGKITASNGQFIVSARHAFPKFAGKKTVTVTVTGPEDQVVRVSELASYTARRIRALKPLAKTAKRQR